MSTTRQIETVEAQAPAEGRTIEAITGEILELKQRGGEVILDIGRRLLEAKRMMSGEPYSCPAPRPHYRENGRRNSEPKEKYAPLKHSGHVSNHVPPAAAGRHGREPECGEGH